MGWSTFEAVCTLRSFPEGSTAMVSRCFGPSSCWPSSTCSFWHLIDLTLLSAPYFPITFFWVTSTRLWGCLRYNALILSFLMPSRNIYYLLCTPHLESPHLCSIPGNPCPQYPCFLFETISWKVKKIFWGLVWRKLKSLLKNLNFTLLKKGHWFFFV